MHAQLAKLPKPKIRSKHVNSRSGCKTCKKRHKKCDETLPTCLRCKKAGKECGGYEQVIDRRTREWRDAEVSDSTSDHSSVGLPTRHDSKARPQAVVILFSLDGACKTELTWKERWHMDYYNKNTLPRFSHFVQSTNWNILVFQMCQTQPAVRHAILAIVTQQIQAERARIGNEDTEDNEEHLLSLHHSTKAIAHLRESLAQEISNPGGPTSTHRNVVLATCVIFAILGHYEGDFAAAQHHLTSGWRLLQEWGVPKNQPLIGNALAERLEHLRTKWAFCSHPELARLFDYEANLSHVQDCKPPSASAAQPETHTVLHGASDGMECVQQFVLVISDVITKTHLCGFSIRTADFIHPYGVELSAKLRFCRKRLVTSLVDPSNTGHHDCDSLTFLTLWHEVINIHQAVSIRQNPDEATYDDHLEQFQRIITLARRLLPSYQRPTNLTLLPFVFTNCLPVLLWCVCKCRDWIARREMLSMFESATAHPEFVTGIALALKRILAIESNGVKEGGTIPKFSRVDGVGVWMYPNESKVVLDYRRHRYVPHLKEFRREWKHEELYY